MDRSDRNPLPALIEGAGHGALEARIDGSNQRPLPARIEGAGHGALEARMDGSDQRPLPARIEGETGVGALEARARSASFFALLAHLERTLGGPPIGGEARADEERIRLSHDPSLAFAAGDVARIERDASDRIVIRTTFLGVSGAVGSLPGFLREEVALEDPERPIRRDLLDVFHHRALSLLYRGVRARRPDSIDPHRRDAWSCRLLAAGALEHGSLDPADRLAIWPLVATRRRSAQGLLQAMRILVRRRLGEGAPRLELRELAGARTPLASDALMRLGRSANALGRDAVLGARASDPSAAIVLEVHHVDPVHEPRFRAGGDVHAVIAEVHRLFDPACTELAIELHLREQRAFALGHAPLGRGTRIAARASGSTVRIAARATRDASAR